MRFFAYCIAGVFAASFTSSVEDAYSNFEGNQENLKTLVGMFGSHLYPFGLNPVTLDDVLSNEILVDTLLPFKGMRLDYFKLGKLLSDLSATRFDDLCTILDSDGFDVAEMVRGYPSKWDSKWKRALAEMGESQSIGASILSKMSLSYCDYLAEHPDEFLTKNSVKECFRIWMDLYDYFSVHKVLAHGRWFRLLYQEFSATYSMEENEFMELLCRKLQDRKFKMHSVTLPSFIKESHLQPLIELIGSESCPYALEIKSDDQALQEVIQRLNDEVKLRDPVYGYLGFDSEPFMGQWAIPKCLENWTTNMDHPVYNLKRNLPLHLLMAIDAFWIYENRQVLDSSLNFLKELIVEENYIQSEYYRWLSLPRPYCPRAKQIALLMKPFLRELPHDFPQGKWHLVPLFEVMAANPAEFWPTHPVANSIDLLTLGTEWVKEQLRELSLGEDEIYEGVQTKTIAPNDSFIMLLRSKPTWRRLRCIKLRVSPDLWRRMIHRIAYAYEMFPIGALGEIRVMAREQLSKIIPALAPSVALSANYQMLDILQGFFTPAEMLSLIPSMKIRNRITLMLHLNPSVKSYHGRHLVNKNSIFFRNWVMLHLPAATGNKIGDLKLLDYYFRNRCFGHYHGFDLFSLEETGNNMVLGVLNEPGTECHQSLNRDWDLSFEPTGPIVEEVTESRKRSREDDLEPSNKRQKTQ